MTRRKRLVRLGAILLGLASLALGGCAHGTCVSWAYGTMSVPYCCKQGNGYCESTCFRTQETRRCTAIACDPGYVNHPRAIRCVKSQTPP